MSSRRDHDARATSRTSPGTRASRSRIQGWLHNRRSSGKIHFLHVRDGTGFIQAVMSKAAVGDETFTQRRSPRRRRASIIVTGTVRADTRAPGGYEIDVSGLEVVGAVARLPDHAEGARRRLPAGPPAPVDSRASASTAILRVRHEVINAVRDFFNSRGFILADTPIFTPAACEGTTTLFPVQYFDDTTAYLTQSGQLYNEANAMALGTRLLLRPDVPRREVEDAPPPHRVLDGRARDGLRDLDDVIDARRGPRRATVVAPRARQAADAS